MATYDAQIAELEDALETATSDLDAIQIKQAIKSLERQRDEASSRRKPFDPQQ